MNHTTDERSTSLQAWIKQLYDMKEESFTSVSGDASFRRYFRFIAHNLENKNNESLIAVDAPPQLENSQKFIEIANLLATNNVPVPTIYKYDVSLGFYTQQDFGDQLLLDVLNDSIADTLYRQAINHIADIQKVDCSHLPLYDSQLLQREMNLFTDWYLNQHLNITLNDKQASVLQTCYKLLEANALEQPQVFVHRDYHSRNIMVLKDNRLGIIDFQDAVKGPITYDLVSLLRDCYIAWPQAKLEQWMHYFHDKYANNISFHTFTRWFDLMGMQRHLKAIGIFCRLNYRDGKSAYLNDIPRTLSYVKHVSEKYSELSEFNQLVQQL